MGRFRYCIEETEHGISMSDQEKVMEFPEGSWFSAFSILEVGVNNTAL